MTDKEILKALKTIVNQRSVTGGTLGTLLEIIAELEERNLQRMLESSLRIGRVKGTN